MVEAATLISFGLLGWAGVFAVRLNQQRLYDYDRKLYEVVFPRDTEPAQIMDWFMAITRPLRRPRWRVLGVKTASIEHYTDQSGAHFILRLPAQDAKSIVRQLDNHLPGTHAFEIEPSALPKWTHSREYQMSNMQGRLNVSNPPAVVRSILGAIPPHELGAKEATGWQLVFMPAVNELPPREAHEVKLSYGLSMFVPRPDKDGAKEQREKLKHQNYLVTLRTAAVATTNGRAQELLSLLDHATGSVHGSRSWLKALASGPRVARRMQQAAAPLRFPIQLSLEEIAALSAIPTKGVSVPALPKARTKHMRPDRDFPTGPITLARSTLPESDRLLGFTPMDTTTHVKVIGATGKGKSNVFKLAVAGLMASKRKQGFIFINPKSEMTDEILSLIPPDRYGDLIYLNLKDNRPVGINPLRGSDPSKTASFLYDVFVSLWGAGPETGDILYNALYVGARTPGMTLYDVAYMLYDNAYCERVTANLPEGVVKLFWGEYRAKSRSDRERVRAPVVRRLRPFLREPMHAVFGQSEGVDFKQAINDNKIIIANLSVGELGEDTAYLFATMVVAMAWMAIQERRITEHTSVYTCFADEFPKYLKVSTDFDMVAATARGYRFALWLAIQDLTQLGRMRDGFITNTRNAVIFPSNANDAVILARELGLDSEDIMRLGKHHAILTTTHDGEPLAPATGYTLPPPEPQSDVEAAKQASRMNYGKPLSEIEREMKARRKADVDDDRPRPLLGG